MPLRWLHLLGCINNCTARHILLTKNIIHISILLSSWMCQTKKNLYLPTTKIWIFFAAKIALYPSFKAAPVQNNLWEIIKDDSQTFAKNHFIFYQGFPFYFKWIKSNGRVLSFPTFIIPFPTALVLRIT